MGTVAVSLPSPPMQAARSSILSIETESSTEEESSSEFSSEMVSRDIFM
jgi:hypothetical protein